MIASFDGTKNVAGFYRWIKLAFTFEAALSRTLNYQFNRRELRIDEINALPHSCHRRLRREDSIKAADSWPDAIDQTLTTSVHAATTLRPTQVFLQLRLTPRSTISGILGNSSGTDQRIDLSDEDQRYLTGDARRRRPVAMFAGSRSRWQIPVLIVGVEDAEHSAAIIKRSVAKGR